MGKRTRLPVEQRECPDIMGKGVPLPMPRTNHGQTNDFHVFPPGGLLLPRG
jgi:hypothetical protein